MPKVRTKCFDEIEFADAAVFHFPSGLPGFEEEHAFVFLDRPDTKPLMFMQSLATPELCFFLFPIFVVDPEYRLSLDEDQLSELQLAAGSQPRIGEDILCAAIVRTGNAEDSGPTANLLAPIVVNLKERIGLQAIQTQSGYSHRHPLAVRQEPVACS